MKSAFSAIICASLLAGAGCGRGAREPARRLRVFHAAGFTPAIDALREPALRDLGVEILAESSGSIEACRKLSELGRNCDLLVLADSALVATLLGGLCSSRLDFATDAMVLAVGAHAPMVEKAESDWPSVLESDGVRFMRTDENQSPVGYRTLIILKFIEQQGRAVFYETMIGRCERVVDDVGRLAPLLKTGEADYAFLYKSLCVAFDIRYIELPPEINLSMPDRDYSSACVTFAALKAGERKDITVCGAPATWSMTVPSIAENMPDAVRLIQYITGRKGETLAALGFEPVAPPHFYGPAAEHSIIYPFAERRGELGR